MMYIKDITLNKGEPMLDNLEIEMTTNDGRWDDDNWVNEQAEISACEDSYERGFANV
jgi:hypothetical protein